MINNIFVLVISIWGFDGDEWLYVGNQIVLNQDMTEQQCHEMADNWSWWETNEYYRFSIECHSKGDET